MESLERNDVVDEGRYSEAADSADFAERDIGAVVLNGTGFLVRLAARFKIATR